MVERIAQNPVFGRLVFGPLVIRPLKHVQHGQMVVQVVGHG